MKIILVDDERIVIDHIKSMIPDGFEIVATATNGKSALRLCEEHRPQIMIVDIRMPVMDGLDLIRVISNKLLGVKFIVLSAYEDFEYARQAISLGSVSSYLIKHQVDRAKLLEELHKAKQAWETEQSQRRMERSDLIKDCATGACTPLMMKNNGIKAPFALLIFHIDLPFTSALPQTIFTDTQHYEKWNLEETLHLNENDEWRLLGDFMINGAETVALFSVKIRNSKLIHESLHLFVASMQTHLIHTNNRTFSIYYTLTQTDNEMLPHALNKVKTAILYSVFCGRQALVCVDDLSLPDDSSFNRNRTIQLDKLIDGLEQYNLAIIENTLSSFFDNVYNPEWDLHGLFDLINLLYKFLNDQRMKKGMPYINPFEITEYKPVYHINEIKERFITLFHHLITNKNATHKASPKLLKALQYIQEHFHEDVNIDNVSQVIGVSSSYLHQLFKRDLERTFLDYLTEYRINQAKRILRYENIKMTEVASRVGYRSPQHFSQVFKKITGILPHQHREEGHLL
jgi:two-component system response regulator YesN